MHGSMTPAAGNNAQSRTNVGNITNVEILPISVTNYGNGDYGSPAAGQPMVPLRQSPVFSSAAVPSGNYLPTSYVSHLQVNGQQSGMYTGGNMPPGLSYPIYGQSPALQ